MSAPVANPHTSAAASLPLASPDRAAWRPVLDGGEAEEALATVLAIADRLADEARRTKDSLWDPSPYPFQYSSLSSGLAGGALLFAYLERSQPGRGYADLAFDMISCAIERLAETPQTAGLYQGFTGIAWSVEHIDHLLDPDDEGDPAPDPATGTVAGDPSESPTEDTNEDIDRAVLARTAEPGWNGDYDLIGGLVGLGVYALERLPRPAAYKSLASILGHFEALSESNGRGIAWKTPAERLVPATRAEYPNGRYDLGVAHGNAGAISFLARLVLEDLETESALRLLKPAVTWFVDQRLPHEAGGGFPAALGTPGTGPGDATTTTGISTGKLPEPARTAWCYGDPGAAISLFHAARALGDDSLRALAIELALVAARRDPEEGMIRDTGLCHGSVGLAHLLNRLSQEILFAAEQDDGRGDQPNLALQAQASELSAASRRWYRTTLDRKLPGQGVAGYLTWTPIDAETHAWREQPGLLVGATGIALALLAACTPIDPAWDRVFLLSLDRMRLGGGR